ncbi:MAG: transcriptional regulator [Caulobacterales bacterium RIFCSPHIGHO2_01_FULL_70_19]|nr:MAG: transcriptional regulator [Caulobacterales bacterium RIFCSPHIGHO2_01_FULL_70_19]
MARGTANEGPHPVDRHVGRRVWEKRLELGYNQSDLARALGLTFQQIQKYEKGVNRISSSKLWDIARFFQVDIGYFFQGLDHPQAPRGSSAETSESHGPVTRHSLEIARLAPRLTTRQQKLAAQIIREMTGARMTNEP